MSLTKIKIDKNLLDNKNAVISPVVTDDISKGYSIGSKWTDISSMIEYICIDNTSNNAQWTKTVVGVESNTISQKPDIRVVPDSAYEGTSIDLNILNYSDTNDYKVVISGGSYKIYEGIISWTLPTVDTDTSHFIQIQSAEQGKDISPTFFKTVLVIDSSSVVDSSVVYDNTTMSEFTTLVNTSIVNSELVASGTKSAQVSNNTVHDKTIFVGDVYNIDGGLYRVNNTGEYNIPSVGLSELSEISYVDVSTYTDRNRQARVSPDGTIMLLLDYNSGNEAIIQSHMNTAFDITTNVYDKSWSPTNNVNTTSLVVSPDGTTLITTENTVNTIYQYSLGTPWDLGSVTYVGNKGYANSGSASRAIHVTPDGTRLYVYTITGTVISSHTLGTPWDISTLTDDGKEYNTSGIVNTGYGMWMNDSGTAIYMSEYETSNNLTKYILDTPFDISTISSYTTITLPYYVRGLEVCEDGHSMFISDDNADKLHRLYTSGSLNDITDMSILSTTPQLPGAITSASLVTKYAISNTINQIVGDTDFTGVKDISINYELQNIIDSSSTNNVIYTNRELIESDIISIYDGNNLYDFNVSSVSYDSGTSLYSTDISSLQLTSIPTVVYKKNSSIYINFGSGYIEPDIRKDTILNTNPLQISSTFSSIDDTGRNITTRVTLEEDNDKITDISMTINKSI